MVEYVRDMLRLPGDYDDMEGTLPIVDAVAGWQRGNTYLSRDRYRIAMKKKSPIKDRRRWWKQANQSFGTALKAQCAWMTRKDRRGGESIRWMQGSAVTRQCQKVGA